MNFLCKVKIHSLSSIEWVTSCIKTLLAELWYAFRRVDALFARWIFATTHSIQVCCWLWWHLLMLWEFRVKRHWKDFLSRASMSWTHYTTGRRRMAKSLVGKVPLERGYCSCTWHSLVLFDYYLFENLNSNYKQLGTAANLPIKNMNAAGKSQSQRGTK